jgi:tetratricopeptide (TPR) repeat protein
MRTHYMSTFSGWDSAADNSHHERNPSDRGPKLYGLNVGIVAFAWFTALASCSSDRPQPNLVELAFLEGTQAERRGDLSEAASKYSQSTVLDPTFCSGYFNLGNVYERQSRRSEALASFEKALICFKSESPQSPRVYSETALKLDIERTSKRIEKLRETTAQPRELR